MPLNPEAPPAPMRERVVSSLERRITGWHVANLLFGIIVGFIIGYGI